MRWKIQGLDLNQYFSLLRFVFFNHVSVSGKPAGSVLVPGQMDSELANYLTTFSFNSSVSASSVYFSFHASFSSNCSSSISL